jgi:tRNA pseudouridine38-40 synthase
MPLRLSSSSSSSKNPEDIGASAPVAPAKKRAREGGPVRYRARVEYDGTDFAGFQLQAGSRTVQGELERALARLSAGRRVAVDGAGRTDAGVHARGQVIAFTFDGAQTAAELHRSLTALLPADVGLGALRRVAADYRPRYRAALREYRYSIWNGPRSPLRERYALSVEEPLDVDAMARAARVFVGRHDFSAFGGADRQPVRTLRAVRVSRAGRVITVTLKGDAFLRQMVRRLVAALLRVGRGRATAADLTAALARPDRPAFAGGMAPARGLCLWRVTEGPRQHRPSSDNRKTIARPEQNKG